MDKPSTENKEDALVALLASCKREPKYDDNFEQDFLHNFHLRKEADQAKQSTWNLLLERLDNYLQNFRGWQWVYASMALVTMLAIGVIIASGDTAGGNNNIVTGGAENIENRAIPVSSEQLVTPEQQDAENTQRQQDANEQTPNDKPVSKVLIEM